MPPFSLFPSGESSEVADDIRELFDDLAATLTREQRAFSGECRPSLDVLETEGTIEIIVDVSGIPPEALRVLFRGSMVIVAGEKAPARTHEGQSFHLVEREFGRFARVVRLAAALDIAQAHAIVRDGELVVRLPKIAERRGKSHRIAVTVNSQPRG